MTEASASLCLILATALKINVNKIVLEWPDLTEKNYEYSIGKNEIRESGELSLDSVETRLDTPFLQD